MEEETLTSQYEDTTIKMKHLNSIIGCLSAISFDEVIPDDMKDALFYVNEELQKVHKKQNELYKPISQLYHNHEKENEENGKN